MVHPCTVNLVTMMRWMMNQVYAIVCSIVLLKVAHVLPLYLVCIHCQDLDKV